MDDCILWAKGTDNYGYGFMWYPPIRKRVRAHRVAFFEAYGYWPKVCRHTCDNPPCINPKHLLDGSMKDNSRDMIERGRNFWQARDCCSAGHEYTSENTYVRPGTNHRQCRACQKIWAKGARERRNNR